MSPDIREDQHGKPSTYNNLKCRCKACKDAWAEYMRPRVKKWREERKREREANRAAAKQSESAE